MSMSYSKVTKTTVINENSSTHQRLVSVFESHVSEHGCSPTFAQLFDTARENVSSEEDQDVINWLESVVASKMRKEKKENDNDDDDDEVFVSPIFFPSEDSFSNLLNTLNKARKSLDICVFTITDDQISNAVIRAHERGVRVRIITDNDKSEDLGSDAKRMAKQNDIPVRVDS
ncbi:hypothetical protein BGZ76_005989, partial [Entomortierella beljakovae]